MAAVDQTLYACILALARAMAGSFVRESEGMAAPISAGANYLAAVLSRIAGEAAPADLAEGSFETALQSASSAFPGEPFVAMFARCHRNLASFLRGEVSGVDVVFEGGDMALWNELQRESGMMRHYSTLAAAKLRIPRAPGRVLEVGGGTGAATRRVFAEESTCFERYTFTDVSGTFVRAAEREFGHYAGFEARRLDINTSPLTQGFATGSYDAVLAVNVVHVAVDPVRALAGLAEMLRPGGKVVLSEGAANPSGEIWAAEPIFAFLSQWAQHAERSQRLSGFYSRDDWRRIIAQVPLELVEPPELPWYGEEQWGGVLELRRPHV